MRNRLLATAGLAGAGLGSILMADVLDRRRIEADPLWEPLSTAPEGKTLTVEGAGGVPLNVETYGPEDAPPIVLLHGWMCTLEFWRLQVHDLAKDHHVVAYDARGHGRSGTPKDGDWSLDRLADDLEAVLVAAVGDDRPALLAGHSMGAMTIAAWAGRYNDSVGPRASRAAFINTGLGDLIVETLLVKTPDAMAAPRQAIGSVVMGAVVPFPSRPDALSHRIVRAVALSPSASAAAVRFSEQMVLASKPRVRAACGRELSRMDLHDHIEHLNVPTLVIAGEKDRLTPPSHAHRLAEAVPQLAGLEILEGCGHMGPLERPEEINRALRDLVTA